MVYITTRLNKKTEGTSKVVKFSQFNEHIWLNLDPFMTDSEDGSHHTFRRNITISAVPCRDGECQINYAIYMYFLYAF